MKNKGLLKLPETWYVKVDENNQSVLQNWFRKTYPSAESLDSYVGKAKHKDGDIDILQSQRLDSSFWSFGQEITFADFKRLVLGEKNADDYGVLGCEELAMYFEYNNVEDLEGRIKENIYFILSRWDYEDFENSKRQSIPLTEYLKLIEPTMEKKYEYKLRDQSHKDCVNKLIKLDSYDGNIVETNSLIFRTLSELNVLDLFFEKIEVKELPIIGGSKPEVSEDGDLIEIAGFQMDMYIIDHFKSFTLGNDIHVSESEVKQIREYLRK